MVTSHDLKVMAEKYESLAKTFNSLAIHKEDAKDYAMKCVEIAKEYSKKYDAKVKEEAAKVKEENYDRIVKDFFTLEIECKKCNKIIDFERMVHKYDLLASKFNPMGDYKEAKDYALKCVEKKKYNEESIQKKQKQRFAIGTLLQLSSVGIYLSLTYVFMGTTIWPFLLLFPLEVLIICVLDSKLTREKLGFWFIVLTSICWSFVTPVALSMSASYGDCAILFLVSMVIMIYIRRVFIGKWLW